MRTPAALSLAAVLAICSSCITRTVYVYENGASARADCPRVQIDSLVQGAGATTWTGKWTGASAEDLAKSRQFELAINSKGSIGAATFVSNTQFATTQPGSVLIKRDAGTIALSSPDTAVVQIDPDYLSAISSSTSAPVSPDRGLYLLVCDLNRSYAREIKSAGYNVSIDDLISLNRHGVRADYARHIRDAGYDFTAPQLVEVSRYGIRADYMRSLKEAGFSLDDKQLVELNRFGVCADYATALREAGFKEVSEIVELNRYGISAGYVRDMAAAGFHDVGDIRDFSRYGLRAADVTKFKSAGYDFSKSDLIDLQRYAVSASSATSLKEAGYAFSAKDLIDLARFGVSTDYARKLKDAGYDFSAQDLTRLSQHGVSASFAAAVKEDNKPSLSADTLIDLTNRGLDANTVKKIRGS